MGKNQKKAIILVGDQGRYRDDLEKDILQRNRRSSVIRKISSSPGSGKTTLIEESLRHFLDNNPLVADDMLDREEKILVLVFNKTNKKEIETRFKKSDFPMDLFEITTINSLFFRHAKSLTEIKEDTGVLGTFQVDYTKSTFSHEVIKEVLETFISGKKFESMTGEAEELLFKKTRFFSGEILSSANIEIIWSLINTYFSSSYSLKELKTIEQKSKFFGKRGVLANDIYLSPEDEEILSKNGSNPRENFVKLVVKRIGQMANFRETRRETYITKEEMYVPVFIEEELPNGEIVEKEYGSSQVVEKKAIKEIKENIIKVPHSYYYKEMIQIMVNNPELMKKIFGRYKTTMVDEAQDNPLSFLNFLLKALKENIITSVSVIGDSLQGIYAFSSPDNFDLLKFCEEKKSLLERGGIEVQEYDLHQTHRFGKAIAEYTNDVFTESAIIGKEEIEDFVYPIPLKGDDFIEKVKKAAEHGTTAIICRTNNESAEMFVRMKEAGHLDVRLESSAKKELSDFVKNGIDAIPDKKHHKILTNILGKFRKENPTFTVKNEKIAKYEEIWACGSAKDFLRKAGYAKLVQFNLDQVEKYIVPQQRGKKKATVIGNSWQLKGQEFESIFVANGYLKKELKGSAEESFDLGEFEEFDRDSTDIGLDNSELDLSAFGIEDTKTEKTEKTEQKEDIKETVCTEPIGITKSGIQKILDLPATGQEKAVLFVAVTRAQKGVFFEDGVFGRAMLSEFILDKKEMKYRGDKFLNGGIDPIESLLKEEEKQREEIGLFSFPK